MKKIYIKKDKTFSMKGLKKTERLDLWASRKSLNGLNEWDYLMSIYDEISDEIFFTTNSYKYSKFDNLQPEFL